MKKLTYLVLAVVAVCLSSCGGKTEAELNAKVDSLQTALNQRDSDYRQLDEFVNVVSECLDSIAQQETDLFNPDKESPLPSHDAVKNQLSRLRETLQVQRQRIANLESQLKSAKGNTQKLQRIIISLKAQLAEKEDQIATLQDEVVNKGLTIEDLRGRLSRMYEMNESQQKIISSQHKIIANQDSQLNEGYVIIGTKSELKDAGVLKKKKMDVNGLDKSMFKTIDIRVVTEIDIPSKKPEILSQMPEDSYTIEKVDKKSCTLRITNPERFWSVSKFLIVRTD